MSSLSVFRHPPFRSLWLASVISNIGAQVQTVAAAWMMVSLAGSETMIALVQTANTLPVMLGAMVAGVLADSYDRRRVMLVAQSFSLIVAVLMVFIAVSGAMTPWMLLAFTFLLGSGTALHTPSWHASVGSLVPKDDLGSAIAMNAMGTNVTRALGPASGGVIVATLGVAVAFVVNALTYLSLIFALWSWRPAPTQSSLPRERFDRALVSGLRYFFMSPKLQKPAFRACLFAFGAITLQSMQPLIARDLLGGGAVVFGLLLAAFGSGAIVGAMNSARLRQKFHTETLCRICNLVVATCLVVLALSTNIALTVLATFIAGVAWLSVLSLMNVTVQIATPKWVLGRVLSIYMGGLFGGMALGAWVWGGVAQNYGLSNALIAAAAVMVVGALLGFYMPVQDLVRDNLDPAGPFPQPELQLEISPRSGPIMIMVDYQINEEDVAAFRSAMQERRRTRLRDGAERWLLLRDLEEPDIWVESFHFPTWLDFIRHHERRTLAEQEIAARLHALHRGEGKPRIHRMIERETLPAWESFPPRRESPEGRAPDPMS